MVREEKIINEDGSFHLTKWEASGKTYQVTGTRTTGKYVLDCIDTILDSDGKFFEIPRRKLTGRTAKPIKKAWYDR